MIVVKKADGTPVSIRMPIREFFKALTEYDGKYANELSFDNGAECVYVNIAEDCFNYEALDGFEGSVNITTDTHYNDWYEGYKAHKGDVDWWEDETHGAPALPKGEK